MQFQDFDLSRRLPFIRSSNVKIIALISFVLLLVGVNVFVILYGKAQREKESLNAENTGNTTIYLPTTGVNITPAGNSEAVTVLNKFLQLVKQGKATEAERLISEYSTPEAFQSIINDGLVLGDSLVYNILGTSYSSMQNYAFITVEFSKNNIKEYHKFTLIKINSEWKMLTDEIIK